MLLLPSMPPLEMIVDAVIILCKVLDAVSYHRIVVYCTRIVSDTNVHEKPCQLRELQRMHR